jgi:hypothetical protein
MAGKTLIRGGIIFWLVLGALLGNAQAVVPPLYQPDWSTLAPEHKAILAPLSEEWGAMDAFQRKKWLGIAQRYPAMSPAEQASTQRNMRDWARLAPEERKLVREKFKNLKKVGPEEKQTVIQQWEEYRALPEEERDELRAGAIRRPQVKTPTQPPATNPVAKPSVIPGASVQQLPASTQQRSPLSPLKPAHSPLVPKANVKPATPASAPQE